MLGISYFHRDCNLRHSCMVVMVKPLLFFFTLLIAFPSLFAQASAPRPSITISGTQFFNHGKPWLAGGVNLRSIEWARTNTNKYPHAERQFAKAAQHFGPKEIDAIRAYGANTVRLQVSQAGLDPRSPEYVRGYLGRITTQVHELQAAGLVVVLAMQWEGPATGVSGLSSMPDASTSRAWAHLGPVFARDRGVLYELFNEPNMHKQDGKVVPLTQQWHVWSSDYQSLIDQLRHSGVPNVLLVDGMEWAKTLRGAPTLSDPLGQLAYAVHPYPSGGEPVTPAGWNRWWGSFAKTHPVMITEWLMNSKDINWCRPNTPQITRSLLRYALRNRISVIVSAFDVPGIFIKNFSYSLTTFNDFHCGRQFDGGPGKAFQTYFLNRINRRLNHSSHQER